MAVLNQQQKWIYLMEPHTASRAVSKALMYQLECGEFGHHHIGIPELTDRRRTPTLHNIHRWDICCTVRNPFDVLVTQYKYTGVAEKPLTKEQLQRKYGHDKRLLAKKSNQANQYTPFVDWVNSGINKFQEHVCTPLRGLWKESNNVCYYEHLNDDINTMFNKRLTLPHNQAHVTKGKRHWSEWWTGDEQKKALQLLIPIYSEFLTYYGYSVEWDENDVPLIIVDQEVRAQRCRKIALL
jgi:hypothetical protein